MGIGKTGMSFKTRLAKVENDTSVRIALALRGELAIEELTDFEVNQAHEETKHLPGVAEFDALLETLLGSLTAEELYALDNLPVEQMPPRVCEVAEQLIAADRHLFRDTPLS